MQKSETRPSKFCILHSAFCIPLFVLALTVPLHAQRVRSVRSTPLDTPSAFVRHRSIALDDTDRLTRLTANATVVAFGDVTHGTHETYAARLQVIPQLVEHGGFRIIAVEGPYAQYAALDDYVRTGAGDPAALLRNDAYWFWNTQETLDLILWARARNAAGITPPIRIAGVDATQPLPVAERILTTLRGKDSELAAFAEFQYGCLPQCNDAIFEVRKRIESRFPNDDELIHAARVVEQGVVIGNELLGRRDAIMAENILWLAARGRVALWGHNEHWSRLDYRLVGERTYRSAGADLHAALGPAYFALGSVVLDGAFYNVQVAIPSFVAPQTLEPPSNDDWALLLDQGGLSSVIVPLFEPLPDFMRAPRRIRFAGSSGPTLATDPQVLADKFDAVLYIRTSTLSALRYFPLF